MLIIWRPNKYVAIKYTPSFYHLSLQLKSPLISTLLTSCGRKLQLEPCIFYHYNFMILRNISLSSSFIFFEVYVWQAWRSQIERKW